MAITKIVGPIHTALGGARFARLKCAIDYALNPVKTEGYIGSVNCSCKTALKEMMQTTKHFGKDRDDPRNRLAYHFVIAWSSKESISKDLAFQILSEFCEEYLGSDYEAVFGMHCDKKHLHGHIVFNSVNIVDGKKYRYEDGDWAKYIQPLTDKICQRNGLHTLEMDTGVTLDEYYEEQMKAKSVKRRCKKADVNISDNRNNQERETAEAGEKLHAKRHSNNKYRKLEPNPTQYIKNVIDYLVPLSNDFDDFLKRLQEMGFKVKMRNRKHIAVWTEGMGKYRRLDTLGGEYTQDRIRERIETGTALPRYYHDKSVVPDKYRIDMKKARTLEEKRYYAKMYKLSVVSPDAGYPTYREVCRNVKEIRRLSEMMRLIHENKLTGSWASKEEANAIKDRLHDAYKAKKSLQKDKRNHTGLLSLYKQIEESGMGKILQEEGYAGFSGTEEKYEELLEQFGKYGFSYDEVMEFAEGIHAELKDINSKIRELRKEEKMYQDIISEFMEAEDSMSQNTEQEKVVSHHRIRQNQRL